MDSSIGHFLHEKLFFILKAVFDLRSEDFYLEFILSRNSRKACKVISDHVITKTNFEQKIEFSILALKCLGDNNQYS